MQGTKHRVVTVAVIAVLNAAWFFTIGCAALCAFASCPQSRQRAPEETCHHKGQSPMQQDDGHQRSPCPNHSFPMASLVLRAAPDITPGLQNSNSWLGLVQLTTSPIPQFISVRDIPSHSPPGFSTGRSVCQKDSLLRI